MSLGTYDMKWTMATKAAVNIIAAIGLAGMLVACAEDIRYREIQGQIPPVQSGYARIYLYTMSPTVDPGFEFSVDGTVVGSTTGYNVTIRRPSCWACSDYTQLQKGVPLIAARGIAPPAIGRRDEIYRG